jgi:hypothetical protein
MEVDPQVASLLPPAELSRRSVIAGALAGGFALAVQPVAATTITTGRTEQRPRQPIDLAG